MSGRPRKFDRDQALDRAVEVFWEHGYAATSMQKLSEAMDMGQQSIYNAFGNKETLFLAALDRYCTTHASESLALLTAPDASVDAVRAFFRTTADHLAGGARTCMVVNTALEWGPDRDPVSERTCAHLKMVERALRTALQRAIRRGELDCDDPATLARYLHVGLQGLAVVAQSKPSKKAFARVVDLLLAPLDN
ncbi:MAG: TetR/AcrR family transcriptional regulator [Proteobacteria bacterium]|nr:TetR/AcrR family transcriptional regulator [Pseudomonadota bacterium]